MYASVLPKDLLINVVGNVKPLPENLTTIYESIIINGKARIGLDEEERRHGLRLLVKKFAPEHIEHGERSIEKSFHRTEIIRIGAPTSQPTEIRAYNYVASCRYR